MSVSELRTAKRICEDEAVKTIPATAAEAVI
jgi:hypothetical protein